MYYVTLVVVGFLEVFLKVANVLVFGVAFIWGLIAIPVSISTTFRILRGWGLLVAFALVWPIVQGLIMGMFSALFINAANTLTTTPDPNGVMLVANLMLLAAVAHLLLAAVMIASPLVANALVSNASAAAGVVMPFVGAAVAAGVGTAVAASKAGKGVHKGVGAIQNKIGGAPSKASLTAPSARGSGPVPRPAPTPNRVAGASSSGVDVGGDGGGSAPPPPGVSKARQQRRGTIIRQQMKKRST